MTKEKTLSSPNRMVLELFHALRRLSLRVKDAPVSHDKSLTKQDAALCILLSIQCVEVFFNVYFRVLVSQAAYLHASEKIISDLAKTNFGLDGKIKNWPNLVFGKRLNLDKGVGQRFFLLKNLRNKLMHFTSTHETFSISGIAIHGMVDTNVFDTLSAESAIDAMDTAEDFILEIFKLQGISSDNLLCSMNFWTGKALFNE